ncbi:DNA-binding protein inhibitor ID-2 [Coregonus clupeaformis]|uniref:DNA-binding protein inhibitor ID-2 n=1 Tax=Coregonus clupeaformis TaxID=59861 RepID=UPI001BE0CFFF|nr:DNA-binding protein inhibitor ID-2 [Coregonus clupeaformis]
MRHILSHSTVVMKAISPVRSMRSNISNSSEHTLGISRSKSPMDDPLSLLYNMNDCYTMLKELVPSLPQNRNVSKMEILQHVIDYILDLQIALDSSSSLSSCQHQQQQLGQGQAASPRNPLATINSDISLITFQSSDHFPKETETNDS